MASIHANFLECTTGTEGTGNITLVRKTGSPLPSDIYSVDDTFEYTIKNGNNWETGLGTVKASDVLERTTVYATWTESTTTYDDTSPSALDLSGTSSVGVVNTGQNIDDPTVNSLTVNDTGQITLPLNNTPATPSLAFGTTAGFYQGVNYEVIFSSQGAGRYKFVGAGIQGLGNGNPQILFNTIATNTTPTIVPYMQTGKTGLGGGTPSDISIIANNIEGLRLTEASSHVIRKDQINAGITASTTQSQGNGVLLSSVNEISTVANTNDTVTLTSAVAGVPQEIINNGANTLQIFPASGDNIEGAGVDTAVTLAAGSRVRYRAYDVTNWAAI